MLSINVISPLPFSILMICSNLLFFIPPCDGISTGKICDAVEVAGKNVLQTSSVVTTGIVSHRYQLKFCSANFHFLESA